MHTHVATGGQPEGCTCPRSACGGSESGPGVLNDCTAHGTIAITHHHAFDCPALPADTDLSRLWLLVTKWTETGPAILRAYQFDRVFLADLRGSSTLWDVAEGNTAEDASRAWQDHIDAMRADTARRQAAEIAEMQRRRRLREQSLAALRRSGQRRAHQILAAPDVDEP
ncbi:hypothetical protein M2271_007220 [Streptomyces sp. LBL]|uniref:hypothetical protein n=1 Tax=Streptomyces sp. LBL TaxID=2940562 RepID=UPI002476ADE8|nr:hypothetical protein [Streptomyces sp. LBL]MDH6629384.1 hypothetical protein [Streptomyces sp. LBL]